MTIISFIIIFICSSIGIYVWYKYSLQKFQYSLPNILLKEYTYTPPSVALIWILRFLIFIGIGILIFGISIPKKKIITENIPAYTLFVLDISRSMISEDILPSRLSKAKEAIIQLIEANPQKNYGIIVFSGKPFLTISNSQDIHGIRNFLEGLSPNYILQEKPGNSGTNIGDALILAVETLKLIPTDKQIVLLTDGTSNIGSNPLIASEEAHRYNIPIYTFGIGTNTHAPLFYTDINGNTQYFYDEKGQKISGNFDDTILKQIASITGGKYFFIPKGELFLPSLQKATPDTKTITKEVTTIQESTLYILICIAILLIFEYKMLSSIQKKYSH